MQNPHLSVVIPSYNEQANLQRGVLDLVIGYLNLQSYSWEIILSDDGSTDGTAAELDNFAARHEKVRVLHNEHAGKGPTVQSGMLAAQGDWRLFTDFDQSTVLSELEKLWPYTNSFPIVIGSREIAGSAREREPWYRHWMGRGFNLLVQTLAVPGIQDTQCGFKLFSAETTHKLFEALKIYGRKGSRKDAFTGAFDVEILYLARKRKYAIKEVPIQWEHHESDRVSPFKDSVRMLKDILFIRLADARRAYIV